ncbi:aarF domain-containing protein kinase 1 isoform X3 [Octopus sinensis]|uniref:AarF domain-containing protein kinase 1 isoform X3 n=1 Tax=Octopus sinensis TaxID=2607531 RepID=A0A7E6FSP6_9MOLL|nr:aarF domain-containing protein kinase 1 isoform X3 [Octopus sinensis]
MFFMVSGFLRRTLKVGFACGTVATTAVLLQKNGWEVSSLGVFRFSRAGFAALYLACDYKISLWNLDPNAKDYEAIKSSIHTRSAERLRNVCLENGGVFIKVGQHIGSLDYLLPKEYVSTMALLYDKVPITPVDKMFAVFKKEFNQEPKDVFSYIDPNPIGSASLSQVYKAQLKDGTDVAVKIQYPQVKARSYVDIKTMTIPKIYWKYSSDKILTMEFCQGTAIDDQDFMKNNKISVNEVSQKLGEVFSEMIFTHGYVHCDPHPGNLLVNKMKNGTTQITLLDHGLYQTLSDEFRLNYSHLWMSLINADVAAIRQAASNLNCGELYGLFSCIVTARSWDAILHGIKKKPTSQSEMEQIQDNATRYIVEISDVLNRIPREMLLVLKTNDVLRGIESKLQISKGAESFLAMSRYCVRTIAEAEEFFCDSIMCKLKVRLRLSWYLLKIRLIGFYLRFFNF